MLLVLHLHIDTVVNLRVVAGISEGVYLNQVAIRSSDSHLLSVPMSHIMHEDRVYMPDLHQLHGKPFHEI